eukprot:CAMPEP_0168687986 /NCGR_PEP_ID=MMETSP0503-20121227/30841_1 /TAXON_ID=89963 /ORGANISM="Heterocapsa rotundata, Strain SCCAP K-0483" /LENGTH=50 /DNA_ID=CAMNT_0008733177 /DNA_START=11 /DNA_END=159 /DNA_ORIENTATION=+
MYLLPTTSTGTSTGGPSGGGNVKSTLRALDGLPVEGVSASTSTTCACAPP